MEIDYQDIITQLGQIIRLALPIGLAFGLAERVVSLVLDAALDRIRGRRERL